MAKNKFDVQPTGDSVDKTNDELVSHIKARYDLKNKYWEQRNSILQSQDSAMQIMLETHSNLRENNFYSAKSLGSDATPGFYSSALPHVAWRFLQGAKLFPDFIDFIPERTNLVPEAEVEASDLTDIHGLMRSKGGYKKAVRAAQGDMIRGESYIMHDYAVDNNGEPTKIIYKHIPWENVRPNYDSTDWMIISDLTVNQYVMTYGKDALKKVTFGGILEQDSGRETFKTIDFDNLSASERLEKTIQVVRFIDPSTMVCAEIHGGNGYLYKLLDGEKYPYIGNDGEPFAPIMRRVFYPPIKGWHGWGPLDFLIPLARTETTIMNATLSRAVKAADPMVMIATNDPDDAEKKYKQHIVNRQRTGNSKPFFVSNSAAGTQMQVQNIAEGVDNDNALLWRNTILDEAMIRTGIDFREIISFAPTAEQQRLRAQAQDRVNRDVLQINEATDKDFALQDLYLIKNGDSKFHDLQVTLKGFPEEFTEVDPSELRDERGMLPPRLSTVRDVVEAVEDLHYEVMPRAEGQLDDMSFKEVLNMKEDIFMLPQGTKAADKFTKFYFDKVHPQAMVSMEDLSTPSVEQLAPEPEFDEGIEGVDFNQLENAEEEGQFADQFAGV